MCYEYNTFSINFVKTSHVCELSMKKFFAVAKTERCLILQQAQI